MTTLDPERQKLLEAKLGAHLTWTAPDLVQTIGPFDPLVFKYYDDARKALIDDCTEKLRTYTDDRIQTLLADDQDDGAGTLRNWRLYRRDDIERLGKRKPPWYAGGFGHPDYQADFDYWARMPSLTLNELLHLTVGVEPGSFSDDLISTIRQKKENDDLWPPLQFLLRREEQLARQFCRYSRKSQISARQFLEWAERMRFEIPTQLDRLLKEYHVGQRKAKAPSDATAAADKREINSIAQLITAIAIEQYGYRPGDRRSPIPKELADTAASLGLSITPETIRKYLRIGAQGLPSNGNDD